MTPPRTVRLFGLLALLGSLIVVIFIVSSRPVQAGFVQNEDTYWNMGDLTLPSNGNGQIEHCTVESDNLKAPNNVVGLMFTRRQGMNPAVSRTQSFICCMG